MTLNSNIAPDGQLNPSTDILGVVVYRESTLEEHTPNGGTYPPTNLNDIPEPITLTQFTPNPAYQLVSWCYVMYGLPATLDSPWSSVLTATILVDTTQVQYGRASYALPSGNSSVPYYPTIGGTGQRNYTNRFGQSTINSLTLDPLGEDYESNQLWLTSPYASSLSWHLNGTILTPGGLPATDISSYLDPYPIEGTAYGYGVGAGSNALNNDPSKTFFVSSAPGFQPAVYNNVPLTAINSTTVGIVSGYVGSNGMCVAQFQTVPFSPPAPGVAVYQFSYTLQGGNATLAYNVSASLQLTTDGTVTTDALGNSFFQVAAITGTRTYTFLATGASQTVSVVALLPICSGPSVSNLDAIYCNNNRLYLQYPFIDRLGLAFQVSANIPRDGLPPSSASTNIAGVYVYRETAIEEANPALGQYPQWSDAPAQSISLTQLTGAVANVITVQWGYTMQCLPLTLEYPCSMSLLVTAIVAPTPITINSSCSYEACGTSAYVMLGFIGTRTFINRYGTKFLYNVSGAAQGEDYADQLLYLNAPYSDGDGITFRLNGTDGALTEVIGGKLGNEMNVYLDPYLIETISTNSLSAGRVSANALNANPNATVVCSTAPGFTSNTYNASNPTYARGSTNMSDCIGATFSAKASTYTAQPYNFSFSYSISDGSTYISVVNVTLITDGVVYTDALGGVYFLPAQVSGTRTLTLLSSGNVSSVAIVAVNSGTSADNRFYPVTPFFTLNGWSVTTSPAALSSSGTSSSSTFSWFTYRSTTIEETPGKYPVLQYQSTNFTTRPYSAVAVPSASASLCMILYSLPGNVDYPWSSATSLSFLYNPTLVSTPSGTAVTIVSGTGTRTYTNRFGVSTSATFSVLMTGTRYLYLNNTLPFDAAGVTFNFTSPLQLPGHGPTVLYSLVNVYNQSGIVVEGAESRVDGVGSAFLSTVPSFMNVTIGASNLNALAPSYATCSAPITFTNGLRPPTQPSVSNGGTRISYSYFISDGVTYSVQGNLTLTTSSAFGNNADLLGNPYQIVTNVAGSRLYTHIPFWTIPLLHRQWADHWSVRLCRPAVLPLRPPRRFPWCVLHQHRPLLRLRRSGVRHFSLCP